MNHDSSDGAAVMARIGEGAVLAAAWQAGLLQSALSGPGSAADHAKALGLDVRAATLVCDALVALGYLARADDGLEPGPALRALERELPMPVLGLGALWAGLPELLAQGVSPVHWGDEPQQWGSSYAEGVVTLGEWGASAAAELAGHLRRAQVVLDLGAGSAVWSLAMDAEHVIGVDMPEVVPAMVARAGRLGRSIETISGDYHSVLLPDADRVVLANVLHLEDEVSARGLIGRASRAARPGGEVVVVEVGSDGSTESERAVALYAVQRALRMPRGGVWSVETIEGWLVDAGLEDPRMIPLRQGRYPSVAVAATVPSSTASTRP